MGISIYILCVCVCVYVQESSLMMQQASLKGELEGNQQQLESSKVTQPKLSRKNTLLMKYVVVQNQHYTST